MSELLTVREAAERLNVSEKTIRNMIKHGQLPFHRIGAGRGVIRISAEAIVRHLRENEVRAVESFGTIKRQRERVTLRHIRL